jgi:dolichol-phosphate mannosyltransferase
MKVSVILPTYNESANIVRLIAAIQKHIPASWEHETLVVDDDSPDGTLEIVKKAYGGKPNVVSILRTADRGLAKAIRTGIERAAGDYILVMDTDFTHSPEEIPSMLHVSQIADLVSGSRFCAGGLMDSTLHYVASWLYNLMIRVVIHTQIQDNLGGFWIARAERIKSLPFDQIFFGYGDYYFRLLHFAQKRGMKVIEVPSHYCERSAGNSKSNFARLLFQYSKEVITFALQKNYNQPPSNPSEF